MSIYIAGSLAFDRIMTFHGKFADHIMPEKLRSLNISFLVDTFSQKRGGTGGNIVHNLALLGEKPILVASVGRDFAEYERYLAGLGLSLEGLRHVPTKITAGAYITTDQSGSQITGFHPGAMSVPSDYTFPRTDPAVDIALIGPTNTEDMCTLPALFRQRGIRYIFDPGQQLSTLSSGEMLKAVHGSAMLISNDYELEMILKMTGKTHSEMLALTSCLITTFGPQGSVVYEGGQQTRIGIAVPDRVVDPTGCGDAYRAGLIKGLLHGLSATRSGFLGAACASFCAEHEGPQDQHFTMKEFIARYQANFGPMPDL
jgi:adenosine kinase